MMSVATGAVIYGVHYQQEYDKAEMHKGVLKDLERRKAKALESRLRMRDKSEG